MLLASGPEAPCAAESMWCGRPASRGCSHATGIVSIRMLSHEKVATGDPCIAFLTEAAYLGAGGMITSDLFHPQGDGYGSAIADLRL